MMVLTAIRLGAMTGVLVLWASSVGADNASSPAAPLEPIVVTAQKRLQRVPDEILKHQVETALHEDRFFPDMHVDVTVKNGIAYLAGVVFDDSDVAEAKRIAKKIRGVKRVVCDFYIPDGQ